MPVDVPQLVPDRLALKGIAAQQDRADVLLQIRLGHRAVPRGQRRGQTFDATVRRDFEYDDVPRHPAFSLALLIEQTGVALDPPGFESDYFHLIAPDKWLMADGQ